MQVLIKFVLNSSPISG
jgi:hypothetical protein